VRTFGQKQIFSAYTTEDAKSATIPMNQRTVETVSGTRRNAIDVCVARPFQTMDWLLMPIDMPKIVAGTRSRNGHRLSRGNIESRASCQTASSCEFGG
jgi:hypothetical protein